MWERKNNQGNRKESKI